MKPFRFSRSGFWMTSFFGLSRASTALAGPWGRGFPPWNSWSCPPNFFGFPYFPHPLLNLLFWVVVIGLCFLLIRRLFFSKN